MEQQLSAAAMTLLSLIVLAALTLPFLVHKVEEELEIFLLVCGLCAVTISGAWNGHLIAEALKEPIAITAAVLVLGVLFKRFGHWTAHAVHAVETKTGPKTLLFLTVFLIGLFSSVLTAIIAALITAEIIKLLDLPAAAKTRLAVYACFAIGFGAVLTPIGEPLSTIVIAKLKGEPYQADFFFLLRLMGVWILPALVLFGALAARLGKQPLTARPEGKTETEPYKQIWLRAGKVYLFVAALILLGEGLKPLAARTITHLSKYALYWINSLSAVLDNATLASIEIMPSLPQETLVFLLASLILAGGLLIPGNIPNIICASKLGIKSREWARAALPVGLALMVVYFILLSVVL